MIAQVSGKMIEKGLDRVVVDVGGVGYLVHISLQTLQALPQVGQEVRLYTWLQVREDALQLFGFWTDEERRAFELCIGVSGIGPKLAMAALSGLDPAALADAVKGGDVARLSRIPGIGKKTAERLIVELRDKFDRAGIRGRATGAGASAVGRAEVRSGVAADVMGALCNLGYKAADAERAVDKALAEQPGAPIDQVLRQALKALQRD